MGRPAGEPPGATLLCTAKLAPTLPPDVAHELVDERGEAMEVVHRDISPHNLFVTYDGSVRVVDFGIARATDQVHETTTGSIKGKYAYMAPEQAKGLHLDHRTDLFALCLMISSNLDVLV